MIICLRIQLLLWIEIMYRIFDCAVKWIHFHVNLHFNLEYREKFLNFRITKTEFNHLVFSVKLYTKLMNNS